MDEIEEELAKMDSAYERLSVAMVEVQRERDEWKRKAEDLCVGGWCANARRDERAKVEREIVAPLLEATRALANRHCVNRSTIEIAERWSRENRVEVKP